MCVNAWEKNILGSLNPFLSSALEHNFQFLLASVSASLKCGQGVHWTLVSASLKCGQGVHWTLSVFLAVTFSSLVTLFWLLPCFSPSPQWPGKPRDGVPSHRVFYPQPRGGWRLTIKGDPRIFNCKKWQDWVLRGITSFIPPQCFMSERYVPHSVLEMKPRFRNSPERKISFKQMLSR